MSLAQLVSRLRRAASKQLSKSTAKRKRLDRRKFLSPSVQQLESRQLLAVFAVNSLSDTQDANLADGIAADSSGNTTIRAAIMQANALAGDDTINLPAGNYQLTIAGRLENAAATGDLDVTGNLTIAGAGADVTTINAADLDRVFHLPSAGSLSISGVTITGGLATDNGSLVGTARGGGLLSFAGTIQISNSAIVGNRALGSAGGTGQGGGIYAFGNTAQLSSSSILGNLAEGSPGAVGRAGAEGQGGGIFSANSTWSLVGGSTIANNRATGGNGGSGTELTAATSGGGGLGGGIFSQSSSWASGSQPGLIASTISENQAIGGIGGEGTLGGTGGEASGGGIFGRSDTWIALNSTISTNLAIAGNGGASIDGSGGSGGNATGGGLNVGNGTSASLSYVTMALNQATGGRRGLGIVDGNIGTGSAGGMFHDGSGTVTPLSTIVATNSASTSLPDVSGNYASAGHNLIGDGTGSTGFSAALLDQTGTAVSPINPILGPLQNNGGATLTHALLLGSPAIDTADSNNFPLTDQRGEARSVDGDGNGSTAPDIGAFEAPFVPPPAVIDIEKFVKPVTPTAPTDQDQCDCIGKPKELTFRYTGGGPSATNTHQPVGKYSVTGDPLGAPLVFIRASDSSSATSTSVVYFSGVVGIDATFTAKAALAGQTRFPANTFIHIFDTGMQLLQTVGYHTSCSAPIVLGDVTGGVTLTGVVGETGSASLPPPVTPVDFGSDADIAPGPTVPVGASVLWTYVVTNPGTVSLSSVVVTDDNETPGNPFDDFHPEPITVLQGTVRFNIGDANRDNLLNPGEAWLYTASSAVMYVGQHVNIAVATGRSPTNQVATDSDPAHYFVPTSCVDLDMSGSSATSGTAGNIRTFSDTNVTMRATAFSRVKSTGIWAAAYLGSYPGGLGVTDTSEGNGAYNSHTVDNIGRDNYVLFEFSQPVVLDQIFLGYVVDDSDLSLWIGTFPDPFSDHLTLSDAVLSQFGFTENNYTESTSARWADVNADGLSGNAIVIAARTGDTSPEDQFKIEKLVGCGAGKPPKAVIDIEKATNGLDADTPVGPTLPVGSLANFTYTVRNFGTVPLSNIVVSDDNGTPESTSDDFRPTPILAGSFNVGDFNLNNLLDLVEVWEYTASRTVTPGPYSNLGRTTGQTSDGRTVRDSDPSYHFGVLSYPKIDIEKFVRAGTVPSQGGDLCIDHGKPASLTFAYTGGGPEATNTHQPSGKYSVTGSPNYASTVYIRVSDRSSATDSDARLYFFGRVDLNSEFTFFASDADQSRFSSNTYVHIFQNSTATQLLQTVGYHTSCSAPIVLGDVTGGVTLTSFVGEDSVLVAIPPPNTVGDLGLDADTPNGPSIIVGQQVVWTYRVMNPGNQPAMNVVVRDDRGTPTNLTDDFSPAAILTNGFNIGDLNRDGRLDIGESWYYRAVDQVLTDGLYVNVGKVTARTVTTAISLTDSDKAYYLGVLPAINVCQCGEKPHVLVMRYTANDVINTSQSVARVTAGGTLNGASLVRIKATNSSNPNDNSAKVYFDGKVSVNQNFGIDADRAGQNRLDLVTYVHYFSNTNGKLLRTVRVDTSCSQPLVLGNRLGGIQLIGYIGERGTLLGVQLPKATAADLSVSNVTFSGRVVSLDLLNRSVDRVATIQGLLVEWASSNKKLMSIKINGQTVFDKATSPISALISSFKGDLGLRRFGPGTSIRMSFEFEANVSSQPGGFRLSADLGQGMTLIRA